MDPAVRLTTAPVVVAARSEVTKAAASATSASVGQRCSSERSAGAAKELVHRQTDALGDRLEHGSAVRAHLPGFGDHVGQEANYAHAAGPQLGGEDAGRCLDGCTGGAVAQEMGAGMASRDPGVEMVRITPEP